eukprot:15350124-Ditylum_brightwellii.AAC.1
MKLGTELKSKHKTKCTLGKAKDSYFFNFKTSHPMVHTSEHSSMEANIPSLEEFISTLSQSSEEQVLHIMLQWCYSYTGNTWFETSGESGYSVTITKSQHQLPILPL